MASAGEGVWIKPVGVVVSIAQWGHEGFQVLVRAYRRYPNVQTIVERPAPRWARAAAHAQRKGHTRRF